MSDVQAAWGGANEEIRHKVLCGLPDAGVLGQITVDTSVSDEGVRRQPWLCRR